MKLLLNLRTRVMFLRSYKMLIKNRLLDEDDIHLMGFYADEKGYFYIFFKDEDSYYAFNDVNLTCYYIDDVIREFAFINRLKRCIGSAAALFVKFNATFSIANVEVNDSISKNKLMSISGNYFNGILKFNLKDITYLSFRQTAECHNVIHVFLNYELCTFESMCHKIYAYRIMPDDSTICHIICEEE